MYYYFNDNCGGQSCSKLSFCHMYTIEIFKIQIFQNIRNIPSIRQILIIKIKIKIKLMNYEHFFIRYIMLPNYTISSV